MKEQGVFIQLPTFEGPLDLLLHLIDKDEIDIYDIPIARITERYLETIRAMEALDLEVGGAFLVMAATLMEIKSRMLLPARTALEAEEGSDMTGEDPREELVRRLVAYRAFKTVAEGLGVLAREEHQVMTKTIDELLSFAPDRALRVESLEVSRLVRAFDQVMRHWEEKERVEEIARETVTVKRRMLWLRQRLRRESGGVVFEALFEAADTRIERIVTFLALLELIRLQEVSIVQETVFAPIHICRKNREEAT